MNAAIEAKTKPAKWWRCPNCRCASARSSRKRDVEEYLLALIGTRLLRCRDCDARYAASRWGSIWPVSNTDYRGPLLTFLPLVLPILASIGVPLIVWAVVYLWR
jgi:hypothetical protein